MKNGADDTGVLHQGTGDAISNQSTTIYRVQTPFKDLHLPTFCSLGICFYALEQVITHPIEVIRTRLQVGKYKNPWISISNLVRETGLRGLYPGFLPTAIGHMPGSGMYLLSYSYIKDQLQQIENRRNPSTDGRQASWVSFTSAALSDTLSIAMTCPVDVVVQRLYLQSPKTLQPKSTMSICRGIWRQHGVRGFYLGSGLTFVNYVPASAIWWTLYENLKATFSKMIESRRAKSSDNFVTHKHRAASMLAGGISGAIITLLTNPLDVVKTRVQVEETGFYHARTSRQSALLTIEGIYRAEGIAGFMKGIGPRVYLWIFFSAYSAIAYETIVDVSSTRRADLESEES